MTSSAKIVKYLQTAIKGRQYFFQGMKKVSYRDGIHFHRGEIQVQAVVFYHPVAEHLPQDIASELRQCGIDEQVLPQFGIRIS